MYQLNEITGDDGMNKETKRLFMVGLSAYIDEIGMTQKDVAERAGTLPQVFSRYKSGIKLPAKAWRDRVTAVLGVDESDLVAIGKKISMTTESGSGLDHKDQARPSRIPTDYLSFDEVMQATRDLQDCYTKMDVRIRLWRAVFEHLPIAALLIKDGLVVYQNRKSRDLGNASGFPLCKSCIDIQCNGEREDCAVNVAKTTNLEASEVRELNGIVYRVDVTPLHINGHNYMLVTAAIFNQ